MSSSGADSALQQPGVRRLNRYEDLALLYFRLGVQESHFDETAIVVEMQCNSPTTATLRGNRPLENFHGLSVIVSDISSVEEF